MTTTVLQELIDFLCIVEAEHYTKPSEILSRATIGQHVRHSIEMYQCLLNGYETGSIDYGKRKRDIVIESSADYAIDCLKEIINGIERSDRSLTLYNNEDYFSTTFKRELFYCDEHTIHHLALIRVGINEIGGYRLNESFGVAPSTIKYRQSCVKAV
jgi:hypothetical protein